MSAWELPTSLEVGGTAWEIRTDFRAVLDILSYLKNPDYEPDEQIVITLTILYKNFDKMPQEYYEEAVEKGMDFIDCGISEGEGKRKPRTMDWEQDAVIIIPSINRVMGTEIRSLSYMHWWTFLGAYMEIGDGLFAQVVNIRNKKSKGKKLEKWEREFYADNKKIIDFVKKYSEEEKEEQERLKAILDGR
nr:MAG TPA: hypothetical protein [Caudoviricetes sp.]